MSALLPRSVLALVPAVLVLCAVGTLSACDGTFRPVLSDDSGSGDGGGTSGDGGGTTSDGGGTTSDGGGGTADTGTGDGGTGDGGAAATVDYCHLQWPCGQTGVAGESSEPVYLWVYEPGVTEGKGAGSGLQVQVGVGADGSDPAAGAWTWTTAAWSSDKDGLVPGDRANDEYVGTFTLPGVAGAYDDAGRASADGGVSWLYCDLAEADGNGCGGAGSADGYAPSEAGALTVK